MLESRVRYKEHDMAPEDWDAELAALEASSEKALDLAIDALTRYVETRVAPDAQSETVSQLREAVKAALVDLIDGRVYIVTMAAQNETLKLLQSRAAEEERPR